MNDTWIAKIKLQIIKYENEMVWKSNAVCNDIDELVWAAKMNLDAGMEQTHSLMPGQGLIMEKRKAVYKFDWLKS